MSRVDLVSHISLPLASLVSPVHLTHLHHLYIKPPLIAKNRERFAPSKRNRRGSVITSNHHHRQSSPIIPGNHHRQAIIHLATARARPLHPLARLRLLHSKLWPSAVPDNSHPYPCPVRQAVSGVVAATCRRHRRHLDDSLDTIPDPVRIAPSSSSLPGRPVDAE